MALETIIALIISLALAGDLFFLAIGAGVSLQPYARWMHFRAALVFAFVHFLMAFLALHIGKLVAGMVPDFHKQAAQIILAFVGIKFFLEANRIKNSSRTFLIEDRQILIGISVASSFNALLAFVALGMLYGHVQKTSLFIYTLVVFVTLVLGIMLGNLYRPERLGRFSKYVGGLVLMGLAIFLLFQ